MGQFGEDYDSRPQTRGVNPEMFLNPEDFQEIMKGDIAYEANYSDLGKAVKKGSEIIAALRIKVATHELARQVCMQKIAVLSASIKQSCDIVPTAKPYISNDYEDLIDVNTIPVYSYNQRSSTSGEAAGMGTDAANYKEVMDQHNQLVSKCIDHWTNVVAGTKLAETIKPNSSHKLTFKQLLAFGL